MHHPGLRAFAKGGELWLTIAPAFWTKHKPITD